MFLFLLRFLRLSVAVKIRAIAAMVFAMENEAAIESGGGQSTN